MSAFGIIHLLRSSFVAAGLLVGLFGVGVIWCAGGGVEAQEAVGQVSLNHVLGGAVAGVAAVKAMPHGALTPVYTEEMQKVDAGLAKMFGGPGAVAAGSGFEPLGLEACYPFYRGDFMGEDGHVYPGHLTWAMHLYGSENGVADTDIYVPAGYKWSSVEPGPLDGAVVFYYPRFGDIGALTLVVFHVREFALHREGQRVRIGFTGGRGGSRPGYRHAHIEAYRGDVGLPALVERENLRIKPGLLLSSL